MADKVIFSVNERVKCYSRGKLYEAKILKVQIDGIKVHYIGWSSKRDEIVTLDALLKETDGSNDVNEDLMQIKEATSDKYTVIDNDEQMSRDSNKKILIPVDNDLIQVNIDNSNENSVNNDLVQINKTGDTKNEKFICECGASCIDSSPFRIKRHSKSQKHLEYMKKLALPICRDLPLDNSPMTIESAVSSTKKTKRKRSTELDRLKESELESSSNQTISCVESRTSATKEINDTDINQELHLDLEMPPVLQQFLQEQEVLQMKGPSPEQMRKQSKGLTVVQILKEFEISPSVKFGDQIRPKLRHILAVLIEQFNIMLPKILLYPTEWPDHDKILAEERHRQSQGQASFLAPKPAETYGAEHLLRLLHTLPHLLLLPSSDMAIKAQSDRSLEEFSIVFNEILRYICDRKHEFLPPHSRGDEGGCSSVKGDSPAISMNQGGKSKGRGSNKKKINATGDDQIQMQGDVINSLDLSSPDNNVKQITPAMSIQLAGKGKGMWPQEKETKDNDDRQVPACEDKKLPSIAPKVDGRRKRKGSNIETKDNNNDQIQTDVISTPDLYIPDRSVEHSAQTTSMELAAEGKGRWPKKKETKDNDDRQVPDDIGSSHSHSTEHSTPTIPVKLGGKGKGRWPDKEKKGNSDDQIQGGVIINPDLKSPDKNAKQGTPAMIMNRGGKGKGRGSNKEKEGDNDDQMQGDIHGNPGFNSPDQNTGQTTIANDKKSAESITDNCQSGMKLQDSDDISTLNLIPKIKDPERSSTGWKCVTCCSLNGTKGRSCEFCGHKKPPSEALKPDGRRKRKVSSDQKTKDTNDDQTQGGDISSFGLNSPDLSSPVQSTEQTTPASTMNLEGKIKGKGSEQETKDNDDIQVQGDVGNRSNQSTKHLTSTITMQLGGRGKGRGPDQERKGNDDREKKDNIINSSDLYSSNSSDQYSINSSDLYSPDQNTEQVTPAMSINIGGKGKGRWPDKKKKATDDDKEVKQDIITSPDLYSPEKSMEETTSTELGGKSKSRRSNKNETKATDDADQIPSSPGQSMKHSTATVTTYSSGKGKSSRGPSKKRKATDDNEVQNDINDSAVLIMQQATPTMTMDLGGRGKSRGSKKMTEAIDDNDVPSDIIKCPDPYSPDQNTEQLTPAISTNLGGKGKGRWPDKKKKGNDNDDKEVQDDIGNSSDQNIKHSASSISVQLAGKGKGRGRWRDKKTKDNDKEVNYDIAKSPDLYSPDQTEEHFIPTVTMDMGGQGRDKEQGIGTKATDDADQIQGSNQTMEQSILMVTINGGEQDNDRGPDEEANSKDNKQVQGDIINCLNQTMELSISVVTINVGEQSEERGSDGGTQGGDTDKEVQGDIIGSPDQNTEQFIPTVSMNVDGQGDRGSEGGSQGGDNDKEVQGIIDSPNHKIEQSNSIVTTNRGGKGRGRGSKKEKKDETKGNDDGTEIQGDAIDNSSLIAEHSPTTLATNLGPDKNGTKDKNRDVPGDINDSSCLIAEDTTPTVAMTSKDTRADTNEEMLDNSAQNTEQTTPALTVNIEEEGKGRESGKNRKERADKGKGRGSEKIKAKASDDDQIKGGVISNPDVNSPDLGTQQVTIAMSVNLGDKRKGSGGGRPRGSKNKKAKASDDDQIGSDVSSNPDVNSPNQNAEISNSNSQNKELEMTDQHCDIGEVAIKRERIDTEMEKVLKTSQDEDKDPPQPTDFPPNRRSS